MHCVQRCVSELQDVGKGAVKLSVVGCMLGCECQWINLQHSWLEVRWLHVLGLYDCGRAAIFCFLLMGVPHCQHCVSPLVFRFKMTLAPQYTKINYSQVFFSAPKQWAVLLRGILRRIRLRLKEMVYGIRHLVSKNMMQNNVYIFGKGIWKSKCNKYDVCLWPSGIGIRYQFLLFSSSSCFSLGATA